MPTFATGVQTIARTLGEHQKAVKKGMRKALLQAGEQILERARYYVPVDTGLLKSTGRATVYISGQTAELVVSFGQDSEGVDAGGGAAYYALWVHENLDVYHAPPTSAKFLEKAERETRWKVSALIGDTLNAETEVVKNGIVVP